MDLIKRTDAIKFAEYPQIETLTKEERVALVMDIPSAEPKQGEWIEEMYNATAQIWKCSECAEQIWQPPSTEYPTYNFCPNCGARMKGADNESRRY